MEVRRLFARTSPSNLIRTLPFQKVRQVWRFIALIKRLVKRYFKSPRQFLQSLDGRNRVAIFDARNVATKQPSSLLDVSLREFLFFSHLSQSISNNHSCLFPFLSRGREHRIYIRRPLSPREACNCV